MLILAFFLLYSGNASEPAKPAPAYMFSAMMERYWASPSDQKAMIPRILKADFSFEEVYQKLQEGPSHTNMVRKGEFYYHREENGITYPTLIHVPNGYHVGKKWPVRFHLHGGTNRPAPKSLNGNWWESTKSYTGDWISVFPAAWETAPWWSTEQVTNLNTILEWIKQNYRVNTNQVFMLGISDGGTGSWYNAAKNTTPWAAFTPMIGNPSVLNNTHIGVDGEIFVPNISNKPFWVINTQKDELYPSVQVRPYIELFRQGLTEIYFRDIPDQGHTTSWWPQESSAVATFFDDQEREPYPDALDWETERIEKYNRAHWLIITELGNVSGETNFGRLNGIEIPRHVPSFGFTLLPNSLTIRHIEDGSAAARAGLQVGDQIIAVNGQNIQNRRDWSRKLKQKSSNQIELHIERKGWTFKTALQRGLAQDGIPQVAFNRSGRSGRVEIRKQGNIVEVRTQGVRQYKLLISPDAFNLDKPITVTTNGKLSFHGYKEPKLETLLKWASIDNDPEMLFAAEITIDTNTSIRKKRQHSLVRK